MKPESNEKLENLYVENIFLKPISYQNLNISYVHNFQLRMKSQNYALKFNCSQNIRNLNTHFGLIIGTWIEKNFENSVTTTASLLAALQSQN